MTSPPAELRVVVAIPTFRRPETLAALLAELPARLGEVDGAVRCEVLVVDNDPAGSARDTVERAPDLSVRYVVEPEPGIGAVRHRALVEASDADLLAFIDDDERPREGWLRHLVDTWRETRPAAVMGRVISLFSADVDPWVLATGAFRRRPRTTGTEVPVAAAGNLLLDLRQVRALDVAFDPALGLTGGEDTLFSMQLVARGGRIVWCNESETEDVVPADRTTRSWTMRRAFRGGNTAVVVGLKMAEGPLPRGLVRARGVAGGAARYVGGCVRHVWGRIRSDVEADARGLRTAHRGLGMVAAALGHVREEYARPPSTSASVNR